MKKNIIPKTITEESLMLWWMHRLAEELENQAILKGGMSLALFDSPRKTNNLDYVFIPFKSKKEIEPIVRKIAKEIKGAQISLRINSKNQNLTMVHHDVSIQLEVSVALTCKSQVVSTLSLAKKTNSAAKLIRMMAFDIAFAHKLAAWNERRLNRDLYDCYFMYYIQGQKPDIKTLQMRLQNIKSRIPKLMKIKSMSLDVFLKALEDSLQELSAKKLEHELSGLLEPAELFDLDKRLKTTIFKLIQEIRLEIHLA